MAKGMAVACAVLALISMSLFAQSKPSIQGVWRVQERIITGPSPSSTTTVQPGIYIYTGGHYSVVQIPGTSPRRKVAPAKDPSRPTDAEKIAMYPQWQQFNASSGTYEIKGTTLTTKPMVAKNESVMAGPGITYTFKLGGNTLWLTQKSEDGKTTTQTKLMRLE